MAKASTVTKKKISRPKKKTSPAGKKGVAAKKTARKGVAPVRQGNSPASMEELENRHGIDLRAEASRLENATPEERVAWALETFPGRIAMSSSFGAQSAVSLHMLTRQYPEIPVILVDTGYFFAETYQFIDQLAERLSLNLKIYSNPKTPAWQEAQYGRLWENGVEGIEQYNEMNKVEPMNRALAELNVDALFSGLRRQQSSSRQSMPVVVSQRGRIKVHPIVDWSDLDVGMYLVKNNLPYHPLWDEGYVSIGDWHTTRKLTDGMTAEDTRFFGLKRECGLNEDVDFQI